MIVSLDGFASVFLRSVKVDMNGLNNRHAVIQHQELYLIQGALIQEIVSEVEAGVCTRTRTITITRILLSELSGKSVPFPLTIIQETFSNYCRSQISFSLQV